MPARTPSAHARPTGAASPAPRDQRYGWVYLFGAVCPVRETGVGLMLLRANTDVLNLHLAAISQKVSLRAFGVITLDGAGWHQTGGR